MEFYVEKPQSANRVKVDLEDNGTGEVSVLLNGIDHLAFSKGGDVVFTVVHDDNKIPGIKYNHNEIAIWGGK